MLRPAGTWEGWPVNPTHVRSGAMENTYLFAAPLNDDIGVLLPLPHLNRARLRRIDAARFEIICTTPSTLVTTRCARPPGARSLTAERVVLLVGYLALGVRRLAPAGFERAIERLADLDGVSPRRRHPSGGHAVLCDVGVWGYVRRRGRGIDSE